MTIQEVLVYFASRGDRSPAENVGNFLGLKSGSVTNWKKDCCVPFKWQRALQKATNGKLKAHPLVWKYQNRPHFFKMEPVSSLPIQAQNWLISPRVGEESAKI